MKRFACKLIAIGAFLLLIACIPPTPMPTLTPSLVPTTTLTLTPTPQPSPTPMPSPTPTVAPIPERPEDFANYPAAILAYLNAGGDLAGLRALLTDWEALSEGEGELAEMDVDDDGEAELIAIIVDLSAFEINLPGNLLIFDRKDGGYYLAYDAAITDPALLQVGDLNADGHTELAFTSTSCGAHTCFTDVYIVAWDGSAYRDLTDGPIGMAFAEVSFEDRDGDGVQELVLHGGIIGSVGAGPQRARTEVYRWDGEVYRLAEVTYKPSNYLYFKVLDANNALLAGDYGGAIALYRQAIDGPSLEVWMREEEREELAAFSRFRLALAYALLGDRAGARVAVEEIEREQPANIYAQVARLFWEAYQATEDVGAACEAVTEFAREHPETAAVLADYGYSNPTFTPEDVCPLGRQ